MTEGEVVSIDASSCRGWAVIPTLPRYALTIHLVLDDRVWATTIADGKADDDDQPAGAENCWFRLIMPAAIADRSAECRILVGESGTYLEDSKKKVGAKSQTSAAQEAVGTYRDALDQGLSGADVIELLYLDLLRRPADEVGLRMKMSELQSGQGSFEGFRRNLLNSQEYRDLSLRVREAPGRIFARRIVYASSSRRLAMERHAAAFKRLESPLPARLLDFLPGLVMMPGSVEALQALAHEGLPDREIYFRALATLSRRPSLIVADRRELASVRGGAIVPDGDGTVALACTSPLFVHGWNRVESSPTTAFRWMEQVGIILNPRPDLRIIRIEVQVGCWYGALDRSVTAVASGAVLLCERHDGDGGALLSFVPSDGVPLFTHRVALVAAAAACPWRYDGTPDMRLISCQVTSVRFRYERKMA